MNCKKIIKKIGIFFLCFLLLFFAVLTCYQKTTKAVVPVVAVGVAALASFLSAAGVSLATQNMTKDSFTDSLYDIANQYSASSGAPTLEETINTQNALNYYYNNKVGEAYVSMSDSVSQWMNGFKNWFVQNFALSDSGETVVVAENKFTLYTGDSFAYYTSFSEFTNGKVPLSSVPVSTSVQTINLTQDRYLTVQAYEDPYQYGYYWRGVRFKLYDALGNLVGSDYHRYRSSSPDDFSFIKICFYLNYTGQFGITLQPTDAGSYSSVGYVYYLPLTLNDVTTSQIDLSGSLADGYSDFEQALSDARSDAGTSGQVAVGTGSVSVDKPYTQENVADAIINKYLTNTGEGVLTGGYADDKAVEDETEAEKVPTVAEIGEGIVLVDGLEDFFPFCIPFDLYEIIKLLNVSPEAPKFNWKMNFGNTGINDYDIEIDLTPYETVAIVFRTLIIIGFLVFLTIKTRDLIRG